ncbi:transcriptional regulator [Leptospira inadai serovar Lyme str. 10]|uniref:Transcriptional regulator n=2 Tax=Leptospira inadai serovar Lyme TaxID=293084 RepID=V6H9Q6_9LEPT|nr:Rrf2 family transcriptional regulator [Leptospira inadai]EQA35767.1 transcriptional regulator [Leptospira inadai serovar Lyme str. 10]PNV76838.1 Rrf2 family transcriptional regulator [Leptospira inadai serovar Lyme]
MATNKRFSVAVHTLATVGYHQGKDSLPVTSEDVAKSVDTNPVVIRNLIRSLKAAGIVESKEGKGGGLFLSRDPSSVTLGDIYRALEPSPVLKENDGSILKACPVSSNIKHILKPLLKDADKAVLEVLSRTTLEQIIQAIPR